MKTKTIQFFYSFNSKKETYSTIRQKSSYGFIYKYGLRNIHFLYITSFYLSTFLEKDTVLNVKYFIQKKQIVGEIENGSKTIEDPWTTNEKCC